MKYIAFYDNGALMGIGTCDNFSAGENDENVVEITEEEYNAILSETTQKMECFRRVISGEIAIDDVPEKWKDEIARMALEYEMANAVEENDMDGITGAMS